MWILTTLIDGELPVPAVADAVAQHNIGLDASTKNRQSGQGRKAPTWDANFPRNCFTHVASWLSLQWRSLGAVKTQSFASRMQFCFAACTLQGLTRSQQLTLAFPKEKR